MQLQPGHPNCAQPDLTSADWQLAPGNKGCRPLLTLLIGCCILFALSAALPSLVAPSTIRTRLKIYPDPLDSGRAERELRTYSG